MFMNKRAKGEIRPDAAPGGVSIAWVGIFGYLCLCLHALVFSSLLAADPLTFQALSGSPVVSGSGFDVYHNEPEKTLTYVNESCEPKDVFNNFVLSLIPFVGSQSAVVRSLRVPIPHPQCRQPGKAAEVKL